jgi:hypothetical protein
MKEKERYSDGSLRWHVSDYLPMVSSLEIQYSKRANIPVILLPGG